MSHRSVISILLIVLTMLISCPKPEEADEIAPIVAVTSPVTGATVEDSVLIEVDASDNESVTQVEFWIDSGLINTDVEPPWKYSWNTDDNADGNQHSIKVKAFDSAGNVGFSETVFVSVPLLNIAPSANLTFDPTIGVQSTVFRFDASGCSDVEDDTSALQVRWDWESDGTWDTEYTSTKESAHQFLTVGSHRVKLEVKDTGGKTGSIQEIVIVMNSVIDIDGNEYPIVAIGDQEWMLENLKVSHYRDGTDILHLTSGDDWDSTISGAYCYYNNDASNENPFGALYNGYAVEDSRNIAPNGWHVPTDEEWKTMEKFLGMDQFFLDLSGRRGTSEGDKLKSTHSWNSAGNGNNESGFTAIPGGSRTHWGDYEGRGEHAVFWSRTVFGDVNLWDRVLYYDYSRIGRWPGNKSNGASVRCVRD